MHGLIPAVLTPNAVLAEAASDTQGPIAVVGAVAAAILIAKTMWTISERTVGRRILLKRRIARLGTTAQLSYFSETLKATPAISRSGTYTALELRVEGPEDESEFVGGEEEEEEEEESGLEPVERPYVESFYVFPDAYIQVITDRDSATLAYSVTTRRKWFRPVIRAPRTVGLRQQMAGLIKHRRWWRPPMVVRLNRTKFAQARRASWRETDELHHPTEAWIGARAWRYSEKHYFGNPGHYQDYVLTSSSAASFSGVDFEALGPISQATTDDSWSDDAEDLLRRFRRDTRITTVTVMSPHLIADSYPWTYGPHGDEVRLLG